MKPAYRYKAELIRTINGDTLEVKIDLGFGVFLREKVRLAGIDAYEKRGKERAKGLEAMAFVIKRLKDNNNCMILETRKKGKFGRWIAKVYLADSRKTLNKELVKVKLAVEVKY